MRNHTYRIAATALAAAALTLSGVGMAFADPGDPYSVGGVNQENTSNTALINPTATVQLSIHKYLGMPTGQTANGTQISVALPPLSGVNFDVYQVFYDSALTSKVDLTTNTGWTAASAVTGYVLTPADITAKKFTVGGVTYYLGAPATVTTDATGTAVFTKTSGVGLYLVNENLATSGTITSAGSTVPTNTITPSSPFFVTLPMTNPTTTTTWMYDVNVYPKNQVDTATKAVSDAGTVTTDGNNANLHAIAYTITSTITDGMSATTMGTYSVYDALDPAVTYVSTSVAIDPDGAAGSATLVTLSAGTDYTLTTSAGPTGGTIVKVVFTAAGVQKLATANAANSAATVVTTVNVTAAAMDADGIIPNTASVIPNQGWMDANPGQNGIPTQEVLSKYGDLVITKVDPQDAAATMTGAVFAVYADPTRDGSCSATDVSGTPISTATITAGNTVTFVGLQASDFYNNTQYTAVGDLQGYCLLETQAPTGYNLNAEPIHFDIMSTNTTPTTLAMAKLTVNNEKSNLGNNLPLTGGAGVAAVSILGLLLVGGGAGYYVVTSRRREEHDA